MIYIMSDTNEILIPKHTSNDLTKLSLSLENNLTHSQFFYEMEVNENELYFYKFIVPDEIKKLETGEYTYSIYKGDEILEKGLLNVGNYTQNKTEYHNKDKKIVQYNG